MQYVKYGYIRENIVVVAQMIVSAETLYWPGRGATYLLFIIPHSSKLAPASFPPYNNTAECFSIRYLSLTLPSPLYQQVDACLFLLTSKWMDLNLTMESKSWVLLVLLLRPPAQPRRTLFAPILYAFFALPE
jgi:hypothetical protein